MKRDRGRVIEEPKGFTMQEMKQFFLSVEAMLVLRTGSEGRMVHKVCNNTSEGNPVLPYHL